MALNKGEVLMAIWEDTVVFEDLHDAYEDESMSIQEIAKQLADRLEKSLLGQDLLDDGTLETLRDVGSVEEFDECLENVYDWADMKRVWIKTF